MNIKNFAINDVAIYQPGVTTGDTITMRFTHVTGNHNIDFEPLILSYASTFFTARIECVIDISQQDLTEGKIWLIDGDGYYNYEIKKNGSVIESGQLFIQAPEQITIENNPNNSVIITQFGAGSSGSSGFSGTNGISGTAGVSGTNGLSGSSGSSGLTGSSGSSGSSGANGISAGRTYYFNQSQNSDVANYKVLSEQPTSVSQQNISASIGGNSTVLMQQFMTPSFGFNIIPSGVQRFYLYFTKPASNDNLKAYVTLQFADANGLAIGGIITSQEVNVNWNSGSPAESVIEVVFATTSIDPTYRMIVKVYGKNLDSTAHTLTFSTENGNYSFVVTSVGVTYATSGSSGLSGSSGITGSSGSSGATGISGSSGSSGSSGLTGPAGSSGSSGANGSSGTSAGGGSATPIPSHLKEMFGVSAFSGVGNLGTVYKTSVLLTGFATASRTFTAANNIIGALMPFADGTTITELRFYNQAAVAGSTVKIGIYKMAMVGSGSSAYFIPTDLVYTISSAGVDCSTTGAKTVTSLNYTLNHADTVGGMWMVGFLCSNTGMSIRTWTNAAQWTYNGDDQAGTLYRSGCVQVPAGSSNLPSTLPTASMLTQTDVISVLYKSY